MWLCVALREVEGVIDGVNEDVNEVVVEVVSVKVPDAVTV